VPTWGVAMNSPDDDLLEVVFSLVVASVIVCAVAVGLCARVVVLFGHQIGWW